MGPVRPAVLGLADFEALLEVGEPVADGGVGGAGAEEQEQGQGQGDDGCPRSPPLRCHDDSIDRWQEDDVGEDVCCGIVRAECGGA